MIGRVNTNIGSLTNVRPPVRETVLKTGSEINLIIKEIQDDAASNVKFSRSSTPPSSGTTYYDISSEGLPAYVWISGPSIYWYSEQDTVLMNADANKMFDSCNKIESIDISGIDTSRVTITTRMFYGCSSLRVVSLFDTSKVTDMGYMFYNCSSLIEVPLFNTSNVTSMNMLFNGCTSLTTVPLFNTSKVTGMGNMFSGCSSLIEVPLFDTSKVTSMGYMFQSCKLLKSIPQFVTISLTSMGNMFNRCTSLTTVPLFDTSKVTYMSAMFYGCTSLIGVPLFNTSKVTDMSNMFEGCSALISAPQFVTTSVTNINRMFYGCSSLGAVPLFDTSKVTDMNNMFNSCSSLIKVPLFNTSNVTDMSSMFYLCTSLTTVPELDVSKVTKITDMFYRTTKLKDCSLKNLCISVVFNTSPLLTVDSIRYMLNNTKTVTGKSINITGCIGYSKLDLNETAVQNAISKGWTITPMPEVLSCVDFTFKADGSTGSIGLKLLIPYPNPTMTDANLRIKCVNTGYSVTKETIKGQFNDTVNISGIPSGADVIIRVDYASLTSIEYEFTGLELKGIDILNTPQLNKINQNTIDEDGEELTRGQSSTIEFFNVYGSNNITDMGWLLYGCSSLTTVTLSDTSKVVNMYHMFNGCSSLTTVPLFDTSKVTDMSSMFLSCSSLTTVPLFDTSNVLTMETMFEFCSSLISVPLFITASVTDMRSMFYGCTSLTTVPLFNMAKVSKASSMFNGCISLTTVPLFDLSSLTDATRLFFACPSLTTVPLFDTSNVDNMYYMFYNCSSLTSIPLFNTSKVTNMERMFQGCIELVTVPQLDVSKVTKMSSMFVNTPKLKNCSLKNIYTSVAFNNSPLLTVDSIRYMLNNVKSISSQETIDITGCIGTDELSMDDVAVRNAISKGWTIDPILKSTSYIDFTFESNGVDNAIGLKLLIPYTEPTAVGANLLIRCITTGQRTTTETVKGQFDDTIDVSNVPSGTDVIIRVDFANLTSIEYNFTRLKLKGVDVSNLPNVNMIRRTGFSKPLQQDPAIKFFHLLGANNITNMDYMFSDCSSLTDVSLSDTSKVVSMERMFDWCTSLVTVPLFDTSKVTNMASMFGGCKLLTGVPQFNTANVLSMDSMFGYCTSLTTVPLFNTSKVMYMGYMFDMDKALTSVPLFDTSNVVYMDYMLEDCRLLTSVQLNTDNVISMNQTFNGCESLTNVVLTSTAKVAYMEFTFSGCKSLETLSFDMSSVIAIYETFAETPKLKTCNLLGLRETIEFNTSPLLSSDSIRYILNNVKAVSGKSIDITGCIGYGSLKLNEAAVQNAISKGWTIIPTPNA